MKDWQKKFNNKLNSVALRVPGPTNPSVAVPLFDSIKYSLDKSSDIESIFSGESEAYLYSRFSNPNSVHLQDAISAITERRHTVLTPNGLSAINLALESLSYPNSMVMYFQESYAPTKALINKHVSKWGIACVSCNIDDHDSIQKIFQKHSPDLLIFESPTNPQLKIADIDFITSLAKQNDCLTIMDNTFAGLHQHNHFDIDVMLHSLSKFAGGHADTMGGSLSFQSEKLYFDCLGAARAKGVCMEPSMARSIHRSLQTYSLRYHAYCKGAKSLAKLLSQEECFGQLIFPGLKSHPEFDLAKKQQVSPGNVIYFELPESVSTFDFMDKLEFICISPSLGSNESVIAPAFHFYGHDMEPEDLKSANISEQMLRLSVGLEDPEILFKDIVSALKD